jgi:hypothetical protein
MPPASVLRAEPPPDDMAVVIRGGTRSLEDAALDRALSDCWDAHGFFGLSVFADPTSTDITKLARRTPLIRRRVVRVAAVGRLREAGFEVMPTFANRYHFSVVVPDATSGTFDDLRGCFRPPMPNPGYDPS